MLLWELLRAVNSDSSDNRIVRIPESNHGNIIMTTVLRIVCWDYSGTLHLSES